jgi:hypothetical protein
MNPFAPVADDVRSDTGPYAAAACKDMESLFEEAASGKFGANGSPAATREALAICNGDATRRACPILAVCLIDTINYEHSRDPYAIYSVAGGLTEQQRRALYAQMGER